MPKDDAQPAPHSKSRLIERKPNGDVFWELEKIDPNDPIPGVVKLHQSQPQPQPNRGMEFHFIPQPWHGSEKLPASRRVLLSPNGTPLRTAFVGKRPDGPRHVSQ